ncbi:MAG: bifunctional methylenetetrahydrofolate dehydrogenase/methenyltetrahydrofolate cyclohydrolase, partial [Bacilli bacterium]|nr:bifunctional methylenetetrahydrofolate dehydrogenase/methenyltetrahydrofolate cyclohydrolase [Bacilli bacterium]
PMARILLEKGYDCNVTVIHSKTSEEDKAFYISHADLIIAAVGKIGVLDNKYSYKKDAVIVDVGINRGEDGKLHGDALPNLPVKLQTPVPGGVGLLTRISLMENLVEAKRK